MQEMREIVDIQITLSVCLEIRKLLLLRFYKVYLLPMNTITRSFTTAALHSALGSFDFSSYIFCQIIKDEIEHFVGKYIKPNCFNILTLTRQYLIHINFAFAVYVHMYVSKYIHMYSQLLIKCENYSWKFLGVT